jgi:uncharacterized protein YciW
MRLRQLIAFISFQIGVNVIGLPEFERHYEIAYHNSTSGQNGSKYHK